MQQLKFQRGEATVKVENLDDLWYLSQIIDPGDLISGTTMRKIKIGKEDDRKQQVVKKPVKLSLRVQKVEFHAEVDMLRISGTVTQGPEDIPHGAHHTFNTEVGSIITIFKEEWLQYQRQRLKEAVETQPASILLCVFDREEAYFALTKKYGFDVLSSISGQVAKKRDDVVAKGSFYQDVIKILEDYRKRYGVDHIVVASPAFYKEDLYKLIKDAALKKAIVLATCSSVGAYAFTEVLKRPEVQTVLQKERTAKELSLVEEVMKEISKKGLAAYGLKETSEAASAGAVKHLLITDSFIQDVRQKNIYKDIEALLKLVEHGKGAITIISREHDGGKKLNGLGGIAALLRYRFA